MEDRTSRRDIIAYRTDENILIDGRLDEPAWEDAAIVDGFYTMAGGKRHPAASRTRVRLLRDEEYLYIGAEMEDKDIIAFHEEKNSRTWEDDVFEAFIKPHEDKHGYYEFHVTPKNTTLQLYIPRRGLKGNFENHIYEGGIQTGVEVKGSINDRNVKDDGWTAEIAIPFSAFGSTAPPPPAPNGPLLSAGMITRTIPEGRVKTQKSFLLPPRLRNSISTGLKIITN